MQPSLLRICAGWSIRSPVLVCYHLRIPKWPRLVDWDALVILICMLHVDEVWINIHWVSCLVTCFIVSLQSTIKCVQTVCQHGCESFNAGCCWRGESPSTILHPIGGNCTCTYNCTWNIIFCCCKTFQYIYSSFVILPFHCSGLSQMLIMIPLPMPITQLCCAWQEGIKNVELVLVYV